MIVSQIDFGLASGYGFLAFSLSEDIGGIVENKGLTLGISHIREATSLLRLILLLVALLGLVIVSGGIYLAFAQQFANTSFNLFGSNLSSTSVGVSVVFIGAVLIILIFQRVLKTMDLLAKLPEP